MEDEIRRLRKIIVRMGFFLIVILVAVVAYFSAQLREMRSTLYTATVQMQQPIKGIDGLDGKDGVSIMGVPGLNGQDGKNATSTHTQTFVEKQLFIQDKVIIDLTAIPSEQLELIRGPQGEQGEAAPPPREPEFALRNGKNVWRFIGDLEWIELREVSE